LIEAKRIERGVSLVVHFIIIFYIHYHILHWSNELLYVLRFVAVYISQC